MLSVFFVPMLYRPTDFVKYSRYYMSGFLSYIILMPMFITIFSIYSMTNLHDVSWGNRPDAGTAGMEAVSEHVKLQEKAKMEYKVYRSNFSLFWFCANGAYYIFVIVLTQSTTTDAYYSGQITYLDIFTMYLGTLVSFRSFFGLLYVIKWNYRYSNCPEFKIKEHDLQKQFKKMKLSPN